MAFRNLVAALAVTASLVGCSTSSNRGVSVLLVATPQNMGQIGNVTLTNLGDQTGLDFFISDVPSGTSMPLRVYTFINKGSCHKPGPVAYAMNDRINTERQPLRGWNFSRSAPVAMQVLLAGEYSIVVRSTPDSGNIDMFCADLK